MRIHSVPIPRPSLIAGALAQIDFTDAYCVALAPGAPRQAEELVRAVFETAPRWIENLMRLRNVLVQPFGLGTGTGVSRPTAVAPLRSGECVGPFNVFTVTPDEVLMGLNDRHLDFRVSVLVREETVTVSTIVRRHNWLGRTYFALVKPFHRRIVPAMMRHGLRRFSAAAPVTRLINQ